MNPQNLTILMYTTYLALSVTLTIWVAWTLHKNGRVFLVDVFEGNEILADSVNHLLVVGFYLINLGFIALRLKYGDPPTNVPDIFVTLSTQIGIVLLVLGGMHFANLAVFAHMRRETQRTATNVERRAAYFEGVAAKKKELRPE